MFRAFKYSSNHWLSTQNGLVCTAFHLSFYLGISFCHYLNFLSRWCKNEEITGSNPSLPPGVNDAGKNLSFYKFVSSSRMFWMFSSKWSTQTSDTFSTFESSLSCPINNSNSRGSDDADFVNIEKKPPTIFLGTDQWPVL